jgi:hypothetical protein
MSKLPQHLHAYPDVGQGTLKFTAGGNVKGVRQRAMADVTALVGPPANSRAKLARECAAVDVPAGLEQLSARACAVQQRAFDAQRAAFEAAVGGDGAAAGAGGDGEAAAGGKAAADGSATGTLVLLEYHHANRPSQLFGGDMLRPVERCVLVRWRRWR